MVEAGRQNAAKGVGSVAWPRDDVEVLREAAGEPKGSGVLMEAMVRTGLICKQIEGGECGVERSGPASSDAESCAPTSNARGKRAGACSRQRTELNITPEEINC